MFPPCLRILILIPVTVIGFCLQAQNILDIDGTVRSQDDDSKLAGVHVSLIKDGDEVDFSTTEKNGKFRFWLDSASNYLVVFKKSGYVSKRISVNTYGIKAEDAAFGFEYKGWNVRMFHEIEGMDYSILEKPFARIVYDTTELRFVYDVAYIRGIKKELAQLEHDYEVQKKAMAKAEAEAAKKHEAEEKQYNKLIAAAIRNNESGNMEDARAMLVKALQLRPGDARAGRLLAVAQQHISADSTDEVLRQDAYKKTLSAADSMFRAGDLGGARAAYRQAADVMPDDKFPVQQLKKVEKQIAASATVAQANTQTEDDKALNTAPENDLEPIPKEEREKMSEDEFRNALAQRFPEGMTEDVYKFGNKVITRRIIVKGGKGNEYRMVRHNWGGVYYFKNGISVTERVWHQETDAYVH